jgi:hypothetical protein
MEPVLPLDRPRALRYTSRALRLVEQRSGRILGELLITHASIGSAVWLLWGALLHTDPAFQRREEPALTIDDVCDLLDAHWFSQGKALKDLAPYFAEATVAAGIFSRAPDAGKAPPETGVGSPVSGSSVGLPN